MELVNRLSGNYLYVSSHLNTTTVLVLSLSKKECDLELDFMDDEPEKFIIYFMNSQDTKLQVQKG